MAKASESACDINTCPENHYSNGKTNIRVAMIGGTCVLNSALAKYFFYRENPVAGNTSAILGAIILSAPIFLTAIRGVKKGKFYMNELVALALLAGFVSGNYQEVGIIAFFMLLAVVIEEKTASGAKASIKELFKLTPDKARIIDEATGEEKEINAESLTVQDVVRVRPGETFPADGHIRKGTSTVSQASITGESLPIDKTQGACVYAGTQNLTGMVEVKVSALAQNSTLGKVREMIEAAEKTRLPIMRMIDSYTVYFTPVILMIAGLIWFFVHDLMRVVLILIVACPCALIVAAPSAIIAALAAAARRGILIKNATHIETAAQVDAIVFDKTGTLTTGHLEVARLKPREGIELSELVEIAVTAESQSNHPIAKAMKDLAKTSNITWNNPSKFTEHAGKGVVAEVNGDTLYAGRESWFKEMDTKSCKNTDSENYDEPLKEMSIIHVRKNEKELGWIGFRDSVRNHAKNVIDELSRLGITECTMITGDNESVANSVACQVGIDTIEFECLPQTKVEYIKKLKKSHSTVAVVGDGVNDAPALATGDIGIAMAGVSNDIAVHSASIALMNNDLTNIPFLIGLSKKTRFIINMNIIFAGLLILGGLVSFGLGDAAISKVAILVNFEPSIFKSIVAACIHISGTLAVFFNSARLIRYGEGSNVDVY